MFTAHEWKTEEHDGGHVGIYEVTRCTVCGASGGPADGSAAHPFLADGGGLQLTLDCEMSQRLIAAYRLGQERAYLVWSEMTPDELSKVKHSVKSYMSRALAKATAKK